MASEYTEDITIWPTMTALLGCVEAGLAKAGRPVGKSTIQYGSDVPALDLGEGCDGFLWVRLVDAFPSTQFPNQDTAVARPGRMALAYQLEVAVGRCVEVGSDDNIFEDGTGGLFRGGQPIPAGAIFEDARAQFADMSAIRQAICSCLRARDVPFVLGNFASAVPTGMTNYIGWQVTVHWDPES